MTQKRTSIARAAMLAIAAILCAAVMTGPGTVAQADVDTQDPTAACRILPECWNNADCDAKCGVGLGKCIHSKCPIRVCRCS